MTEDQKYRIAVLAEDAEAKRLHCERLGMMDTPTDPAERTKFRIEYAIAVAEHKEAEMLLWRAQNGLSLPS